MPLPSAIVTQVRSFAREHALLRPGPLVVAVSGGTDSTALLLILAELAGELGLVLHVAHFDHRARPRAGAQDAQFVAGLAAHVGAPIRAGRAERATKSEDEARGARYAFLRRVAGEIGATAIATGHTRDDQAETVLLHAARGSGLAGIAGMRPERDGIVRPLLAISRADTSEICAAAAIAPREDATNRSIRFARNRVRRRVIPELEAINPQASAALARLAASAADALHVVRARAAEALDRATDGDAIDLTRLPADRALAHEALALAWERATGQVLPSRARDALAALAASTEGSAALDLPGGRARREYARLTISTAAPAVAARPDGERRLVSGTPADWLDWTVLLAPERPEGEWSAAARVPPDVAEGLIVRARRPGDRMAGDVRTKVQDVLTDAKVPARIRDRVPLVVTRTGDVWWIPGITERSGDGWHIVAKKKG